MDVVGLGALDHHSSTRQPSVRSPERPFTCLLTKASVESSRSALEFTDYRDSPRCCTKASANENCVYVTAVLVQLRRRTIFDAVEERPNRWFSKDGPSCHQRLSWY